MSALERCSPLCPNCVNPFVYAADVTIGLLWTRCRYCGWRGLVRFWRSQA